jgi:hypothetical protein
MARAAPAPLQVGELFGVLDRHRVDYVLVGGMASVAHGAGRPSFDVDAVPAWSPGNLDRLALALRSVHARLRMPGSKPTDVPATPDVFRRFDVSTWRTPHGDLDVIIGTPTATRGRLADYEDLIVRAFPMKAFGTTIHVADIADVIEASESLRREPDLAALPALHRLHEHIRDRADRRRLGPGPDPS